MYKYQEGDRLFRLSDLTSPKDFRERPNTYYPIHDPKTDIYYPCNPQRVWAYASDTRVKAGQKIRGDTIEALIAKELVWFPPEQRVEVFSTMSALLDAIARKDVPMSGNTPLLFDDMLELEAWVGRRIGYGRPAFKRFKEGLKNENQPISSWLTPKQEEETFVAESNMPVVGTTEDGSKALIDAMGEKAFPYPKPPSVIKSLLAQATRPDDIVLDFFAGSGTTGQAVLELNAEDGGQRRFILCSITEATSKEPDKNLCRDVCAERLRRVIAGYGGKEGYTLAQGGEFAYLQLDKVALADLSFETKTENAMALLSLRLAHAVWKAEDAPLQHIARADNCDILLCREVNAQVLQELAAWPDTHGVQRLAVYCERPQALQEALEAKGLDAHCYSVLDALCNGQAGARA
jgi:adenine-specific DNA-methyltransferase